MSTSERIKALGGIAALTRDVLDADDEAKERRAVETAAELCCRFAPDAPDTVMREAIARCAGWLADAPSENLTAERVGELHAEYAAGQIGALRHSGAMSVLSPWKARRAGAIG